MVHLPVDVLGRRVQVIGAERIDVIFGSIFGRLRGQRLQVLADGRGVGVRTQKTTDVFAGEREESVVDEGYRCRRSLDVEEDDLV